MIMNIEQIQIDSEKKLRFNNYKNLINKDLEWKINHSFEKIKEYINYYPKDYYTCAFSGGKDSSVLLSLLLKVLPAEKISLVIANELFYPDIKENIEIWVNKYKWHSINYRTPKVPFVQFIKENGVFYASKEYIRNIITYKHFLESKNKEKYKKIDRLITKLKANDKIWSLTQKYIKGEIKLTDKCCSNIKNSKKDTADFVGLRATEGRQRLIGWIKTGCNDYKGKHSKPISLWTDNNIFTYMKNENLNIPKIYNFVKRTGCILCPFGWRKKQKFLYDNYREAYDLGWELFEEIFKHFGIKKI